MPRDCLRAGQVGSGAVRAVSGFVEFGPIGAFQRAGVFVALSESGRARMGRACRQPAPRAGCRAPSALSRSGMAGESRHSVQVLPLRLAFASWHCHAGRRARSCQPSRQCSRASWINHTWSTASARAPCAGASAADARAPGPLARLSRGHPAPLAAHTWNRTLGEQRIKADNCAGHALSASGAAGRVGLRQPRSNLNEQAHGPHRGLARHSCPAGDEPLHNLGGDMPRSIDQVLAERLRRANSGCKVR